MGPIRRCAVRGFRMKRLAVSLLVVAVATGGLLGFAEPAGFAAAAKGDGNGPLPVGPAPSNAPTAPTGDWSNRPPSPADSLTAKPVLGEGKGFDPARSVVDDSKTTADRRVFINADGTTTAEVSSGPVRFKGSDDEWHDYDLRLRRNADVPAGDPDVAAKRTPELSAAPADRVATGSDRPVVLSSDPADGLARLATPAGVISVGSPDVAGTLGNASPSKADDSTLEYVGDRPGVTVQMRLATAGVEQLLVVDSAKGPSSYVVPITVPAGVTARPGAHGEVEFVDAAGAPVGVFRGGDATDSTAKRSASTGVSVAFVDQQATVVHISVSIDAAWFADPARVFPVTIDPWYLFGDLAGTDTYVQYLPSGPGSTPKDGQGFWSAGLFSGGAELNRGFVQFTGLPAWDPTLAIQQAQLFAYNYGGETTAAKTMRIYPVSQFMSPTVATATNPPTVDPYVPSTTSSVSPGWSELDATPLVRQQLTTGNPSWGVSFLIVADDENDTLSGKNFYSTEHNNQFHDNLAPALRITYKHLPTAQTLVSPVDQSSIVSTTPTLSATPSTSDTGPMQYWFEVATGADGYSGTVIYASGWQTIPVVGGKVSWAVPAGYLENGGAYHWTVRSFDGEIWNNFVPAWTLKIDMRLGASGPSPFDQIGPATVNLANGNLNFTTASQSMPAVGGKVGLTYSYNSQAPSPNGLTGTYYNTGNWSGTPAAQRRETTLWNAWGTASPVVGVGVPNWSAKYTGFLTVPATNVFPGGSGTQWKFAVSSHAGMLIKINGVTQYDSVFQPSMWNFGTFQTTVGFNQAANATAAIEIDYFNDGGGAAFDVRLFPGNLPFVGHESTYSSLTGDWLKTDAAPLSAGWDVSADDGAIPYTRVINSSTGASMVTADGQIARYTSNGAGGYTPDSGLTGHLAFNWTAGQVGWDFNDSGFAEHFNVDGTLAWAFNATDDRHPAALQYVYASLGTGLPSRLTQIKDPVSNRAVVLRYSGDTGCHARPNTSYDSAPPGGMLCQADFTGSSDMSGARGSAA